MQKTSEPVFVVLPQFAVDALDTVTPISGRYFFRTGEGNRDTVAGTGGARYERSRWACCLRRLEQVSILPGHGSIRITEGHYPSWIRDRHR
jgi:hypothetical protein